MTNKKVKDFQLLIWNYYHTHKRQFPWRETNDPYAILVSEFMLQQTQTDRVVPKYERFLRHFPSFNNLATASFAEVFRYWQGLGYNRRAKYLLETAKIITTEYGGTVPSDVLLLEKLPGIGTYTARAIATFAYNQPHIFIETNIRSVYLHHFFPSQAKVSDKELVPLIEKTLDQRNPREWYYALMDYGSMLKKTASNPNHKSTHYTKQTRFDGSNRQVRGQILKLLANQSPQSLKEITTTLPFEPTRITYNLAQLEEEGFICKEPSDKYRLS